MSTFAAWLGGTGLGLLVLAAGDVLIPAALDGIGAARRWLQ